MDAEWLFAPPVARSQDVQADAGDDRRQPAAEVVDLARVGAADPQPGLLDGVVSLRERAEHPVGHRPQVRPVLLEAIRQPVVSFVGHILLSVGVIQVTPSTRRRDKGPRWNANHDHMRHPSS